MNSKAKIQKKIGLVSLAMMSVAGIFTLRTLPLMAEYGFSAVFFHLIIAVLFFIPSALICAELATGWPETGGLYIWVREAFGDRLGFLAIWFEWTNTVVSFPASLAFIAGIIAYALNPSLANNKYYMLSAMLTIFWGSTFINFLGIKFSGWVSNIGLILGTLFPCFLIIGLGFYWVITGHPIQIQFSLNHFVPTLSMTHSAFVVGLVLGYAGMQITAFHAAEVKNPQSDYPKAMAIAVIIILFLSVFGSLAISIVIPEEKISVVTGLMQAARYFFESFHLGFLVPIVALLTAIGVLSSMNMWVIGPCKGLLASARYGDLPKSMQKINRYGAPTHLLLIQACVATCFSLIYLLMPSIASSYWILVALTIILTLPMDILIFGSVIRLRYTQPHVNRAYRIPGGKIGVWLVAGTAILVCIITFILSFVPPEQLQTGHLWLYEGFLIGGLLLFALIPFVVPHFRK